MHDIHTQKSRFGCARGSSRSISSSTGNSNTLNSSFYPGKVWKLFKRGGFSKLGGMTVQRGCSCPFMKYLESLALLSLVAAAGHFLLAYSKGKSASVQTAPPRLPRLVLTQVLLISQLSNLTIITWLSFVYVKTTYPTGNIRLIISSPSKLHGALAADGQ